MKHEIYIHRKAFLYANEQAYFADVRVICNLKVDTQANGEYKLH